MEILSAIIPKFTRVYRIIRINHWRPYWGHLFRWKNTSESPKKLPQTRWKRSVHINGGSRHVPFPQECPNNPRAKCNVTCTILGRGKQLSERDKHRWKANVKRQQSQIQLKSKPSRNVYLFIQLLLSIIECICEILVHMYVPPRLQCSMLPLCVNENFTFQNTQLPGNGKANNQPIVGAQKSTWATFNAAPSRTDRYNNYYDQFRCRLHAAAIEVGLSWNNAH